MIEIISGFILSDFINVIDEQSILMIYDDSVQVGSDKKAVYNKMKPYQIQVRLLLISQYQDTSH